MWAFIRVENEHLNNVGDFRRVDFVPLHFQTAVVRIIAWCATPAPCLMQNDACQGPGHKKVSRQGSLKSVQLEAVLFVIVVVTVAVLAIIQHF